MIAFILKRLAGMIPVLLAVVLFTFVLIRLAPGGPFDKERKLPPAIEKNVKAKYRLDLPMWRQFGLYLRDLVRGDLGPSIKYRNRTVNEIIGQTLPVSMSVGAIAYLIAVGCGVSLGSIAAVRQNSFYDRASMTLALVGICVPIFVLAPLSMLFFCFRLGWFPVAGWGGWRHAILPAVLLSLPFVAYIARLMRNSLIEVLQHDFIRTARAKGVDPARVIVRHAFKLALMPVISFLGPMAAEVLTGSIVIELIFNLPGMGTFFVSAVFDREYNIVSGITLVFCVMLLFFNLVVDVLYHYLDPRIRLHS